MTLPTMDMPLERPQRTSRLRRPHLATLAMTLAAVLASASPGHAGLIMAVPTIRAAAGTSGTFDVLLFDDDPASGVTSRVAGDSLELALAGPAGVRFTGVTIATAVPYIFALSGTTQGGGPLSLDAFPAIFFLASDAEFAGPGYAEVGPGGLFGIAHVSFTVDADAAPGDRSLVVGAGSSLSDEAGAAVAFEAVDGLLTVLAVPEPPGWLLLAAGLAGPIAVRLRVPRPGRGDAMPAATDRP
jgi:hypothetical protein